MFVWLTLIALQKYMYTGHLLSTSNSSGKTIYVSKNDYYVQWSSGILCSMIFLPDIDNP